jgi:peptide/nickel transport system permease protein
MATLLVQRLLSGLVTLWAVSVLVFAGTEILPGDIVSATLGQSATPEVLAAMREELGLGRPAAVRYFEWMSGFVQGDLGTSLALNRPVAELVGERVWNTFLLTALTALFAVPLSIGLGLLAVAFPRGFVDNTISLSSLIAISLPEFFTGALLVVVFAVNLGWFPAMSYVPETASWGTRLHALVLPTVTLTLALMAHAIRMTRATVLDVMQSAYVEMAVLKGVSKGRIILRHALPNAFGPIANVIALSLGYLVTSVVVVEAVFAYPGLGRQMVDAVATRDPPLVQAIAMIFCIVYVVVNLLADLVALAANPRIRMPK